MFLIPINFKLVTELIYLCLFGRQSVDNSVLMLLEDIGSDSYVAPIYHMTIETTFMIIYEPVDSDLNFPYFETSS